MAWILACSDRVLRVESDGTLAQSQSGEVQCLAADPHRPRVAYAGLLTGEVLATDDGGRSWRAFDRLPHPVFSMAASAWDGSVYAGCEPSTVFRWPAGSGPAARLSGLESLPSRPTWSFPPRPWTSHVRWIATAPDGPALLCGIELGGIVRSPDAGESWEDQRPGAHPDCHSLAWPEGSPVIWEAAGTGAAFSRDGGESWTRRDQGLDRRYCWSVAPDAADPEVALISASPGPGAAHHSIGRAEAALYRLAPSGWQRLTGGLPDRFNHLPTALRAVGPGHLVAWLRNGEAWETQDRGESWTSLRGPLPGVGHVEAAVWMGDL